jgi:hypothetical protein
VLIKTDSVLAQMEFAKYSIPHFSMTATVKEVKAL